METVFITIHDLSLDARIKFCSDSVEYVLGYTPQDVRGKSCWEYFHPDEIPFAKQIHGRGIELDKAAALNYARIKHKDGSWIGCECVFTVVHNVLIGCTSVYTRGPKAMRRAADGANVRRIFASSPRDPRYHMLSYLSAKFYQEPKPHSNEPRAALFLNRFTRTSTIMYATSGVQEILGISPEQLQGKSFYFCIEEQCLQESVKCLESAKSNDSIAYLRFRYRDPLQTVSRAHSEAISDTEESDEEEDGGVSIPGSRSSAQMSVSPIHRSNGGSALGVSDYTRTNPQSDGLPDGTYTRPLLNGTGSADIINGSRHHTEDNSRTSSGNSTDLGLDSRDEVFDPPESHRSQSSQTEEDEEVSIEVEAVVSCTSDGLVVILRRARPLVPHVLGQTDTAHYENGMFASPWAPEPVMPSQMQQTTVTPQIAFPATVEPAEAGFMEAIRDVAVFAWSLTGINGSLTKYSRGTPSGDALPPGGLPIWDPNATRGLYEDYNGFSGSRHRPFSGMGDPAGMKSQETISSASSDDEVVWKRAPTMAPWRRPKRRAHRDAFGEDGEDDADGENSEGGRKKVSKSSGDSSSA